MGKKNTQKVEKYTGMLHAAKRKEEITVKMHMVTFLNKDIKDKY